MTARIDDTPTAARGDHASPGRPPAPPASALRSGRAISIFLLSLVVLLSADLVLKSWSFRTVAGRPVALDRDARSHLAAIPPHAPVPVVPGVLALQLTVNHGAVFGIGQGGRIVFIGFSVLAIIVIALMFARSGPRADALHVVLGAVLAGALGNLYDRLVFGGVRDMFLLFPGTRLPFGLRWPGGADGLYPWIFNLADVCLVLGLGTMAFMILRADRAERRSAAAIQRE
ncbi:MAG: signal peptidase II [Phycisphaeraceae bacterium]|nr:signal peptidase II [Phycisphaeraceae bacterium]